MPNFINLPPFTEDGAVKNPVTTSCGIPLGLPSLNGTNITL